MSPETKRTLVAAIVTAAITAGAAILLALTPMDAHAQPASAPTTAGLMLQWQDAHAYCSNGDPEHNPACARQARITTALEYRGCSWRQHDVWVTPEQIDWYVAVVQKYNTRARGKGVEATYALTPGFMGELRAQLSDSVLFALWNSSHTAMRDTQPAAWALLSEAMEKLARQLAHRNDPTLTLDY